MTLDALSSRSAWLVSSAREAVELALGGCLHLPVGDPRPYRFGSDNRGCFPRGRGGREPVCHSLPRRQLGRPTRIWRPNCGSAPPGASLRPPHARTADAGPALTAEPTGRATVTRPASVAQADLNDIRSEAGPAAHDKYTGPSSRRSRHPSRESDSAIWSVVANRPRLMDALPCTASWNPSSVPTLGPRLRRARVLSPARCRAARLRLVWGTTDAASRCWPGRAEGWHRPSESPAGERGSARVSLQSVLTLPLSMPASAASCP
jgi:hypothetical protein